MAVTIIKREEFKKYVGYFEGKVVAVNPSMDKLIALGINVDKEPEYLREVEDKVLVADESGELVEVDKTIGQLSLTFYIQDVKSKNIFSLRFFLKNKERWSKDKSKRQFMNSQGSSSWALSEEGLHPFMTERGQTVRYAHDGEADMYDFIKTWLNQGNFQGDFELMFDWKDLMKGKTKEIEELIKSEAAGTIMCPATVKTSDEGKHYQQIFAPAIVSGYAMSNVRLKKIDEAFIENAEEVARTKSKTNKLSPLQRSVLKMVDRDYGCTDAKFLGELREYDESKDFVSNNNPVTDPTDASY